MGSDASDGGLRVSRLPGQAEHGGGPQPLALTSGPSDLSSQARRQGFAFETSLVPGEGFAPRIAAFYELFRSSSSWSSLAASACGSGSGCIPGGLTALEMRALRGRFQHRISQAAVSFWTEPWPGGAPNVRLCEVGVVTLRFSGRRLICWSHPVGSLYYHHRASWFDAVLTVWRVHYCSCRRSL